MFRGPGHRVWCQRDPCMRMERWYKRIRNTYAVWLASFIPAKGLDIALLPASGMPGGGCCCNIWLALPYPPGGSGSWIALPAWRSVFKGSGSPRDIAAGEIGPESDPFLSCPLSGKPGVEMNVRGGSPGPEGGSGSHS